ncbi:hypothetical protein AMJ86_07890 [bacterium SM23_57]|nr:MAG: hypothetical protein AMJ86_07890 [bacterium SM23_57]
MAKLDSLDTEILLQEILSSAKALKEATESQKEILDTVALNKLDRVLVHKSVLIDKISSIHQELKERGLDLRDRNGSHNHNGNGAGNGYQDIPGSGTENWNANILSLCKTVERTIREILAIEADSQKKLLSLKQHVRGILLDIQERRKMLRAYAVHPGRYARVLDTKT